MGLTRQRVDVLVRDLLAERDHPVDGQLHAGQRERRVLRDLPGELVGHPLDVGGGHELIDHADLVGALRVDEPAGEEEMPRVRGAQDLHQLLAQREGDEEPDTRQRHAEARALGGHAEVAVERQLAAARDGVAVHHGDGGMAGALDPLEHLGDAALGIALGVVLALAHLAEVHSGAEGRPLPSDHHHPHVRVLVQRVHALDQPVEHRAIHRVAPVGAVHGQRGHTAFDLQSKLVSHKAPSAAAAGR